jgi:DNA-binding transcriptional ArsR family regulator
MEAQSRPASEHTPPDVLAALAHHRRRRVLGLIESLDQPSVEDLAAALADAEADASAQDDPTETRHARVALEHAHLPHLADRGLVAVEDGTVTTTDHPALADPFVRMLIDSTTTAWDDVLDALADDARRLVLAAVRDAGTAVDRAALAARVADRIPGDDGRARSVDDVDRDLHHYHLPALDAAGLVTYDPDAGSVTYDGHSTLADAVPTVDTGSTRRSFLTTAE